MTEEDGDPEWDHVVDVICVGSGPGLDGYASACAAADLEVLRVAAATDGPEAGTAQYLSAMTEGLSDGLDARVPDEQPAVVQARAVDTPRGRGVRLEPFVGEDLRIWSARCLASPSGVMMTHVPDHVLTPMRTQDGAIITAAVVPDDPVVSGSDETFAGLVYADGAIAGAILDGPSGRWSVRAECGIAFTIGRQGAPPGIPSTAPPGARLAVVGRPAGRFARLEILAMASPQ